MERYKYTEIILDRFVDDCRSLNVYYKDNESPIEKAAWGTHGDGYTVWGVHGDVYTIAIKLESGKEFHYETMHPVEDVILYCSYED